MKGAIIGGVVWGCVMFPVAYVLGFAIDGRLMILLGIASITDKLIDGPGKDDHG